MSARRQHRGRRVATTRRPRPTLTRSGVAAAVLVTLAGVAVGTVRPAATEESTGRAASGELVTHVLRVCPDSGGHAGGAAGVQVGSVPVPGVGDSGSVRLGPLGEQPDTVPLRRGESREIDAGRASTAVQAEGDVAAGLFAFRAAGSGADMSTTGCPEPRAAWWFTGAGATLDHTSTLVLANADPGPAVVDVTMFDPHGAVDAVGTRGMTIAPHSQREISLTDVAPQSDEVAIHVEASRGRVAAAVADEYAARPGARPGAAWLTPAARPTRVLRLGGTTGPADRRSLLVANPSDLEALVEVQVAGPSGTFTPADLKTLRVPPGAVEVADVTSVTGKDPQAIRLRSRVPVLASLRSVRGGEVSYSGMVAPLRGPAAAPVPPGSRPEVLLTAGAAAGQARVTAYDAKGRRVDRWSGDVPEGTTTSWAPKRGADYVVVDALEGAVSGAVSYSGGAGRVPLTDVPLRLPRPAVEPELREP